MRKFFSGLIWVILGLVFLVFAVANRHAVTVSFDPVNANDPALGVTLPLFLVIIIVASFGVVAGSAATWIRQGHWRRSARRHETEARIAQAQLAEQRAASRSAQQRPQALPNPSASPLQDRQNALQ